MLKRQFHRVSPHKYPYQFINAPPVKYLGVASLYSEISY